MRYYVYIMASRPGGAIHIGLTDDLRRAVSGHRAGMMTHTRRYRIGRLVWFEAHPDLAVSALREKRLKRWRRTWKDRLVTEANPDWRDITHLVPDP